MKCPSCGENVADGVAICPKCDAVVDMDFLTKSDSTEPAAKPLRTGNTGVKKAVRPKGNTGVNAAVPRKPAGNTGAKPAVKRNNAMPEAPAREIREPRVKNDDWKVKDEGPRPVPAPANPSGYHMVDPEDFWGEVKGFVGDLTLADKLAFIGAFSAMVSCFFPWKDTITDGEVLGLMSLGAAVFAVTVVIIIAIIIRVRKVMPALHALVPWLIQFGGACFCIVWCLVYIKLALDTTMARSPIGNFERWVSSPSAGVYIALLMSVMMLGGTLMGLKEKPR